MVRNMVQNDMSLFGERPLLSRMYCYVCTYKDDLAKANAHDGLLV